MHGWYLQQKTKNISYYMVSREKNTRDLLFNMQWKSLIGYTELWFIYFVFNKDLNVLILKE